MSDHSWATCSTGLERQAAAGSADDSDEQQGSPNDAKPEQRNKKPEGGQHDFSKGGTVVVLDMNALRPNREAFILRVCLLLLAMVSGWVRSGWVP